MVDGQQTTLTFGRNYFDEHGKPAGGHASGIGFCISWQRGPAVRPGHGFEKNGAFVEEILDACLKRLEHLQSSEFECPENTQAMFHIQRAVETLNARSDRRRDAGKLGTHQT